MHKGETLYQMMDCFIHRNHLRVHTVLHVFLCKKKKKLVHFVFSSQTKIEMLSAAKIACYRGVKKTAKICFGADYT